MKKLITLLLAAVLAMSMSFAAFADEDPAALLERVTQKSNELDSMDTDIGIHAVLIGPDSEGGELTLNLDMIMKIKMDQMKSGNIRYKAEMAMEFFGQTQYASIFYKDGYYYMDMDGEKIKYPMDLDSMIESVEQMTGAQDLTPSLMQSISVRQDGENRILSYVADPAKMNAYVQQVMGTVLGGMDMNFLIREVKGEYVVNKDDYYTDMNMYMVMEMNSAGEKVTMIMLMEGIVNNPGQSVTFELPPTDGYKDLWSSYGLPGSVGQADGPASEIQ